MSRERLDFRELSDHDAHRLAATRAAALVADFGSIDAAVRLFRRHPDRVLARCSSHLPPVALLAAGFPPELAFRPDYDPRDPAQVARVHALDRERERALNNHPDAWRFNHGRSHSRGRDDADNGAVDSARRTT
jgi:hypothetical protein